MHALFFQWVKQGGPQEWILNYKWFCEASGLSYRILRMIELLIQFVLVDPQLLSSYFSTNLPCWFPAVYSLLSLFIFSLLKTKSFKFKVPLAFIFWWKLMLILFVLTKEVHEYCRGKCISKFKLLDSNCHIIYQLNLFFFFWQFSNLYGCSKIINFFLNLSSPDHHGEKITETLCTVRKRSVRLHVGLN